MSWLYNTGPCHCYVGPSTLSIDSNGPSLNGYQNPATVIPSAYYIGTCEQYPLVEQTVNWNPVYNDIAGPMMPIDKEFQGQGKLIVLDLTRFNETNIDLLDMDDADGGEGVNSRGKLLLANGQWSTLWIKFEFFGTINQVAPDLPPGEMYYATSLLGKYYDRLGTQVRKTRLVVEAMPVYYAAQKRFITYSRSPAFFSGLTEPT